LTINFLLLSRIRDILALFRDAKANRDAALHRAKPKDSDPISGGKSTEQSQGRESWKKARAEKSGGTSDARFSLSGPEQN
jgi:hypothetical protein